MHWHFDRVLRYVPLCLLTSFLAVVATGCGSSSSSPAPTTPVLPAGTVSSTTHPLVAQYTVSPPQDAQVTVEFGPDTSYGFQTSSQQTPKGGGATTLLVAGMQQNSTYHMRAVVTYSGGQQVNDSDHTFTTGPVPAGRAPDLTVTNPGGTPAPGVELVGLTAGSSTTQLRIVAIDPAGNLIWYYDYPTLETATPIKQLANGHYMVLLTPGFEVRGILREIDLAGNTIHEFSFSDLNGWLATAGYNLTMAGIHHDFVALPNGHLLLLASLINKNVPGFTGIPVQGDVIVDLDPTFKPVWVWNTFDHLDVSRHPMGFPDWTHCNALLYLDDGNILLSSRHQSWLIKIDYANGQGAGDILWKLGYQGDFALASDNAEDWFYAQHFPNVISPNSSGDFTLAVFDNGDDRVVDSRGTICGAPGAPACYSRPAVFEVNEATKGAQLMWGYASPYSFWGGAVQELPSTNIFFNMSAPEDNPAGARAMEVTQETTPQVIWRLDVNGQNSYRTIHMTSLYPGVQW